MANILIYHSSVVKSDLLISVRSLKQAYTISLIAIFGCCAVFYPGIAFSSSCAEDGAFFDSSTPYISGTNFAAFDNPNNNQTSTWGMDEAINMNGLQNNNESETGYQFQEVLNDQIVGDNFSELDWGAIKAAAKIPFDGYILSPKFLEYIAQDPIVKWGFVRDEDCEIVEGEVWLIVVREDKYIFFHLVDTPNSNNSRTAYSGYDVKVKNVYTATFYEAGAGTDIPHIGNDRDLFFVASSKMLINTKYDTSLYTQTLDNTNVGVGGPEDVLLHVADILVFQNIPQEFSSSMTIEPNTVVQVLLPSGELISENVNWGTMEIASSVSDVLSSTGTPEWCEGAGDVAETVDNVAADILAAGAWTLSEVTISGISGGIAAVGGANPYALGAAAAVFTVFSSVNSGMAYAFNAVVENVAAPTAGALVEASCDKFFGNPPNLEDDLLKILGDVLGVQGSVNQTVVCDNWEPVEEESESDHDNDQLYLDLLQTTEIEDETSEEVTVWGDDDPQTCTEWHVETYIDAT